MLEATKVKISGSQKSEQDHIQHFLHKTCNSEVSGSFTLSSCKATAKKCTKKCAARAQFFFLLIRPTVFLAVFVAVAAQYYTMFQ